VVSFFLAAAYWPPLVRTPLFGKGAQPFLRGSGLSIRHCLTILASFIAKAPAQSGQAHLAIVRSCQVVQVVYAEPFTRSHSCQGLTNSPTMPATPLVWAGGCPGGASLAVTSSRVNPGGNSVGARSVAIRSNV
jgi:hypothetical protein